MTHYQLYKTSAILFMINTFCFTATILEVKLVYIFKDQPNWFMIGQVILLSAYFLQPLFRCGYRTARKQLAVTIWQIIISPFGLVRFRDFFFADIITSMGEPLKDFWTILYLLTSLQDYQKNSISDKVKESTAIFFVIVAILPFWWRFWQCLNKLYYHKAVT
jgi:hypothetical protein